MTIQQQSSIDNVARTLRERRPHTKCAFYHARRGLTLVELLVVIVILTMVTAATIPLMSPATGERKVRESARLLSTMLAQAQARALATGRPAGVWIQRQASDINNDLANQSIDLFMCEVPAPYSGESSSSLCRIVNPPPRAQTTPPFRQVNLFEAGGPSSLPPKLIRRGDLVRFNYRGPLYKIIGPAADGEGVINGRSFNIQPQDAWTSLPALTPNSFVPYQIFRQPMKSAGEPVTLPVGAAIDLTWSGLGSSGVQFAVPGDERVPAAERRNPLTNFPNQVTGRPSLSGIPAPVLIMFGPSGNLASVYYSIPFQQTGQLVSEKAITPVYLLVGQSRSETFNWQATNLNNQNNIWVAVNPQSGLVTASEVGCGPSYWQDAGISSPQLSDYQTVIATSRQFARSAQNMGGR
jgi:prepilin-type N-terminal cleavage/methylation domain-containing protein